MSEMTAEEAMHEAWGVLCPDCGPDDYAGILAGVKEIVRCHEAARQADSDVLAQLSAVIGREPMFGEVGFIFRDHSGRVGRT